MLIKSIKDIDFSSQKNSDIFGTIIRINTEGDENKKRPIKFTIKIEGSGELIDGVTWKYDMLESMRHCVDSLIIVKFQGVAKLYNGTPQLTVDLLTLTNKQSTIKNIRVRQETSTTLENILTLIKSVKDKNYKRILNLLILKDPRFKTWPAATRVHHAYIGGLADHSLNVANNVNILYRNYINENLNLDLLITGALLHDIGKLREYNEDGSKTLEGMLMGHIPLGAEMINNACVKLEIDSSSKSIMLLKHIILSHHEKQEYGSPISPVIMEAILVSKADALDAKMETGFEAIENALLDEPVYVSTIDGYNILKWRDK